MTTTECQMLDCMGEVRYDKKWLEAPTNKVSQFLLADIGTHSIQ